MSLSSNASRWKEPIKVFDTRHSGQNWHLLNMLVAMTSSQLSTFNINPEEKTVTTATNTAAGSASGSLCRW